MLMLELQGELVSKDQTLSGQRVGRLEIKAESDGHTLVELYIGNHVLDGKMIKLAKPLVVANAPGGTMTYRVTGVVRYKAIFTKRPRVLDSKHV